MRHLFTRTAFVITLTLLFTACRSTHAVSRVQGVTQTTDVSQSRVDTSCTLTDFLRLMDLQADSIVMWWEDEAAISHPDTAQGCAFSGAPNGASPRKRTPHKLLLSGVHLNATDAVHTESTSASADSLKAFSQSASSSQEKEKTKAAHSRARIYLIMSMIFLGMFLCWKVMRRSS